MVPTHLFLAILIFIEKLMAVQLSNSCFTIQNKHQIAKIAYHATDYNRASTKNKCEIYLHSSLMHINKELSTVYKNDGISVHTFLDNQTIHSFCEMNISPSVMQVFVLKPREIDRTCLLKPSADSIENLEKRITLFEYDYTITQSDLLADLVDRINAQCHLFRTVSGTLNTEGKGRSEILKRLTRLNLKKCKTVELSSLTSSSFFKQYLSRSTPVIIKDYANVLAAYKKWNNLDFFLKGFGSKRVHVKLSPSASYEGVEPRNLWQSGKGAVIPDYVLDQLTYSDLVVVRPAPAEMTMRQLIGVIRSISLGELKNASAYLEYTSLESVAKSLVDDVPIADFLHDLTLETSNMWLSDGNTIGKLHFDAYDNILVQLVGTKNLTLFDPFNNENLYESHIQEAQLDVKYTIDENGNSAEPWHFDRLRLMDSTSMVMSPIDLSRVDFKRFPNFANATPVVCTLNAGDALFMPSYWWHEVKSTPDPKRNFNLAVNFWFKPFFTKEIPCATCRVDVNSHYYQLINKYMQP